MQTEGTGHIEEILYDGLTSLDDPRERVTFLDQTCRGNPGLRARLEQLVSMRDEAEEFFATDPECDALGIEETRTDENVSTAESDLKEGLGTRIGRYRLLECLGEGGCGVVYLAEQSHPVIRRVALKIIRVGTASDQIIKRFEMERQTLALMDHPNIARVLDAGSTSSGRPFFVMQLVEGLRITEFCDQNRYDLRRRLELFIPVCRAIQHAHQKGIIHCDIKPSNVMVTLHDGVAVPRVIDFGIAKASEAEPSGKPATASSPLVGTPAYMSPEQVDGTGLDVDTRSDIYSLGALLYELLTGMPPRDFGNIDQSGPEEIRNILRDTPLVPPSERLLSCPSPALEKTAATRSAETARLPRMLHGDLDAIVMKAMQSDRRKRYNTASGLATDLTNYLHHEPVNARGAGRRYRLGKLVRRNKVTFAAGAMVALALAGGFGTSTWLLIRENHARQEQERLKQAAEVARANEVKLREKAQAGEIVAHAAVILSHDDIARADSLLAQVDLDNVPSSLESAATFRAAGVWLLHEGRLEDASKRFAAVAQAIGRADKSQSDSISIHFVAAAAAMADVGDTEHYERLREMAADRFAGTTDPFIADEVAKSCLIMPASPKLLAKLEPLIKVLESNLPWDRTDEPEGLMEAWQTLSLSLVAYRKGDFYYAESWARRCLRHPNQNPARNAAVRAILAMALHQAGHPEHAHDELESVRTAIAAHFNQPFEIGESAEGFWFDWMIARILLKEAEGIIAE